MGCEILAGSHGLVFSHVLLWRVLAWHAGLQVAGGCKILKFRKFGERCPCSVSIQKRTPVMSLEACVITSDFGKQFVLQLGQSRQ